MQERRVNVRAIIFKDGQMLAQKFKTYDGGVSDYWGTPGGGLDHGEELLPGLKREIFEETAVEPVIGRLLFVHQFYHGEREKLEFFFHIENPEAYTLIDLAKASHGHEEIAEVTFIPQNTPNLLPAFLQKVDIEKAIANTQPVYINSELRS